MKKSTLIIFCILTILKTQAQDYLISFAGTGESTIIDSVQVGNLTQNTSLTINGTDILHLMGIVGVNEAVAQINVDLRIYPNPTNENCIIEFEATCSGIANVDVFDITGKQVAQTQNVLHSGRHTFLVSGLSNGIYTLRIKSAGYFYSGKIVCTNIGPSNPKISYESGNLKSTAKNKLKSTQALVPMQYNNGDQLLFKCFSSIYSTVIPLVPEQSQMVIANLVACTDVENNNYATVTIGTQVWMAENLKVGVRIDGVQEQTNNGTIEKYCYDNNEENCTVYGGLYQWNEMMQYTTTLGVQGICPSGWHLPTDGEWTTVTTFLGGTSGTGGKMKSTGTIEESTGLWYSPNLGATNESGFTAIPAGNRDYFGTLYYVGSTGFWWSSSEGNTYYAWLRYLTFATSDIDRIGYDKSLGFSVRCVRDEGIPFTCGSPITINHVAGTVVPVNKTVTYGLVANIPGEPSKCWITSNLGADHQATAVDDPTEASAGWYWQFNRKQGYKHDGTTLTPSWAITSIIEDSDWLAANDPCTIEMGTFWRIPTYTEWNNVDNFGDWNNWNGPWNSGLKLHASGYLFDTDGSLSHRGSYGYYWSSIQSNSADSWILAFNNDISYLYTNHKAIGFPIRCLRDESIPFTCGSPITINHVAGAVAPVDKTVTYGLTANIPGEPSKCWITSNLGADHQATAVDDATEESAGWYWQFNRKQGYKHDGTTLTPSWTITSIIEDSDWLAVNDPCAIEMGASWRIPTYTEWNNVDNISAWTNWNGPWNSGLKLHASGYLYDTDGSLSHRGSYGYYWSSIQKSPSNCWILAFNTDISFLYTNHKAIGFPLRCIKDN